MRKYESLLARIEALESQLSESLTTHKEQASEMVSHMQNIEKRIDEVAAEVQSINSGMKKHVKKLNTQLQLVEKKALRIQQQPYLSYFVLNILDHCNLNCIGCDHFAPLAQERFVALEDIKSDLQQMSLLTKGKVGRIGIMGGEPLLHPNLPEILPVARKAFPETIIQVVSNGLLLLKQTDEFWNICKKHDITIVVTKYPLNLDHDKMLETANAWQVKFQFKGNTGTAQKTSCKAPLDIEGLQDPKQSFWNCYHVNTCPFVMEGKIYPCTIAPNIDLFNQKFGTSLNLEEGDYLDIYRVKDYRVLLAFLSTPKPFCRYCRTKDRTFGHPWERSKQDVGEWI
ncbi:MAG: radical SAM protein [Eggerthellaceae bacterium]|nr:radical SAM protein [Eggerthellaceae bacterium]